MSTPRRISKKTQSAVEDTLDIDTFKAWLSGVEDMQAPDWFPSAEQWKKIRSKIDLLTVVEDDSYSKIPPGPIYRQPGIPYQPPQYQPPQHASLTTALPGSQLQGPTLQMTNPVVQRPNLTQHGSLADFQAPGAGKNGDLLMGQTDDTSPPAPYESKFG